MGSGGKKPPEAIGPAKPSYTTVETIVFQNKVHMHTTYTHRGEKEMGREEEERKRGEGGKKGKH